MADVADYAVLWNEQRVTEIELMQHHAAPGTPALGYFEDRMADRALKDLGERLRPGVVIEKRLEGKTWVYRFTIGILRSVPDLLAWARDLDAARRAGREEAIAHLTQEAKELRGVRGGTIQAEGFETGWL